MTTAVMRPRTGAFPLRLLAASRNLIVGTLLCLTPLTALIALGWIARKMRFGIRTRWFGAEPEPGWLLGPPGRGWVVRLIGGLAANIRAGVVCAAGLAALSLPFTLLWSGAWWAGWENSFNKGYEQAAVGPLVWLAGTLIALPVLAHLPLAMAHAAHEGRIAAFFEWRVIRGVAAASGWRLVWLALIGVVLALPIFGMRAIPVFIEDVVPGFADMSLQEQGDVAGVLKLAGAALAFVYLAIVRGAAARVYAFAAPGAAQGAARALWAGHRAAEVPSTARRPSRVMATLWLIAACAIWLALPVMIVAGQFLNYAPISWLTHPAFLLPWVN